MEPYVALHFHIYGRDLVFVLVGSYVGVVSSWFQLNVTPLSCRWLKATGSGAASRSKWTVPFLQASMACGTCMSLLWCSCMHHPIRTMGKTSPMVSSSLFGIALIRISRLLSLQDLDSKGSGFPSRMFPPSVNEHLQGLWGHKTKRQHRADISIKSSFKKIFKIHWEYCILVYNISQS